MLVQDHFAMASMRDARRVVSENGFALLTASGPEGLRAVQMPCLLDWEHDPGGDAEQLVIVGHTARADPVSRYMEDARELLLVFQGPHGYISPGWYEAEPYVPTWNFVAVHVHGVPELLEAEEGFAVLERTVDHFEAARERPWRLAGESLEYARRIAGRTVPFRVRSTRVEAKAKLSQDKPAEIQERVADALERPGPYQHPELAAEMRDSRRPTAG